MENFFDIGILLPVCMVKKNDKTILAILMSIDFHTGKRFHLGGNKLVLAWVIGFIL